MIFNIGKSLPGNNLPSWNFIVCGVNLFWWSSRLSLVHLFELSDKPPPMGISPRSTASFQESRACVQLSSQKVWFNVNTSERTRSEGIPSRNFCPDQICQN
jgi:hypothetical protein